MSTPNLTLIPRATVYEDSHVTFLARVMVDSSNTLTPAVQADLSAITYGVYDSSTEVGTGSLTVASVIYNSLQTGTIWTIDTTGFNFKTTLANTLFPTGDKTYEVFFKFTLTSGNIFHVQYDVSTVNVRLS